MDPRVLEHTQGFERCQMNLLEHLNAVQEVVSARPFGLITDVDGVLAEIAPTAESARVTPACQRYLAELAQRLPLVAVVSGRPLEVVRSMVGVPGAVYVGNHGLEVWKDGAVELAPGAEAYRGSAAAILERLTRLLSIHGVTLEDKAVGIAFHYNQAKSPESARAAILQAVKQEPSARAFRVVETRRVIELRPPIDATKGTAVEALVEAHGLRSALYMGDDFPDVDAFVAVHRLTQEKVLKGLAVLVDNPDVTDVVRGHADYTLAGVAEVARFLEWLTREPLPS